MTANRMLDLNHLIPADYRLRDDERNRQLQALLEIIAEHADIIRQNTEGLWDDFFIETCANWVIPYIGDLVGNNPLHEVAQRRRADVARTIHYRRRKGTLPMLEELARDVTGWGARAVAFFELVGWTQNLNHERYQMAPNPASRHPNAVDRVGTVNLRNLDALDHVHGPFDIVTHTVDVRPIGQTEGWHNIRKVGFFLWRLRGYPMANASPRQSTSNPHGYHLGLGPAPLFNKPKREEEETALAREIHVPGPIRPIALGQDLERCRQQSTQGLEPSSEYYGKARSLLVIKDGIPISPKAVVCQNLENWPRPPDSMTYHKSDGTPIPIDIEVGIDPRLGRLSFPDGKEPQSSLLVSYYYGFSADIGGGPYDRTQTLADLSSADWWPATVGKGESRTTLQEALTDWNDQPQNNGVIEITDNGVYGGAVTIDLAHDRSLVIQARDGCRPNLRLVGNLKVTASSPNTALTLNGLLIQGRIDVQGSLGELNLVHCTLVPGRTLNEDGDPVERNGISLSAAEPNERLRINIASSILGPLRLPEQMTALTIRDSIVDALSTEAHALTGLADDAGPPTTLERTTVFGQVNVKELTLASEVIFTGRVVAERRQAGCLRSSYVPECSQTPRRYRCQPDIALEGVPNSGEKARIRARLTPAFTSVHYGHPAYAQLALTCPEEIRTGAEDGSEMGAFSSLKQPQRETNLRVRLEEYLPFGLEPGLIYVT